MSKYNDNYTKAMTIISNYPFLLQKSNVVEWRELLENENIKNKKLHPDDGKENEFIVQKEDYDENNDNDRYENDGNEIMDELADDIEGELTNEIEGNDENINDGNADGDNADGDNADDINMEDGEEQLGEENEEEDEELEDDDEIAEIGSDVDDNDMFDDEEI